MSDSGLARRARIGFGLVLLGTATLMLATSYSSGSLGAQPDTAGLASKTGGAPATVTRTVTAPPQTVTRTVTKPPCTVTKTVAGPTSTVTQTVTSTAPAQTVTSTVTETDTTTATATVTAPPSTETTTITYIPPTTTTVAYTVHGAHRLAAGPQSSLDTPRVALAGLFGLFAMPFLVRIRRRRHG